MSNLTRITEKYQITIPKEVREKVGLKAGETMRVIVEEDGIKIMTLDQFYDKYTGILHRKGANAVKDVKWIRRHMYD